MAEYRLNPAAERDLEKIWAYTLKQWGLEQAHRYIDNLTKTFAGLAQSPKSAPTCDQIRRGYHHKSGERHMVYFCIADYGIVVVRILHDRMNALGHL